MAAAEVPVSANVVGALPALVIGTADHLTHQNCGRLPGKVAVYGFGELGALVPADAAMIHKAQNPSTRPW